MEYLKKALPALIVFAVIAIAFFAWKKYEKETSKTMVNPAPGAPFFTPLPGGNEILGAPDQAPEFLG